MDPLRIGPLEVWPPVVLAPMAGVTNVAFRSLCREHGNGLFVSEMVGARALAEGSAKSDMKAAFAPDEDPRSIQLYGVTASDVEPAVDLLVREDRVDHIDLNFGCPAPKITRHGGGAALPWRRDRFRDIVRAAVGSAGDVPITVKLRLGIDDDHLTFLDAGRIAQQEGAVAVALHARTAFQGYGGQAAWDRIGELKRAVDIPVLGNGDIWEAKDAIEMVERTGCDGVVVGRGCLGRPWLFRDLQDAFEGRTVQAGPTSGEVGDLLVRHGRLLVKWMGEHVGVRQFRKHPGWYLLGYPIGRALRATLSQVNSLQELEDTVAQIPRDLPFDEEVRRNPRGHTTGGKRVILPEGWLDSPLDDGEALDDAASLAISGG
jgi:nifR3 family TIM-barrel protein